MDHRDTSAARGLPRFARGVLAVGLLGCVATTPQPRTSPRPEQLRVIALNDLHGALAPWRDGTNGLRGGAPALASAIRTAERECVAPKCVSLIVDGGDMFQGTLLSNLQFGRNVVEFYHRLGVAAAALGNHEFDWTIDTLRARMHDARYSILGANVRTSDGRDAEWIPDDTIVQRGGLKIGIVGLATTETPRTTMPSNVASLRFVPLAEVARTRARSLRERGADVVLVIGHLGARCTAEGQCSGEAIDLARDAADARIDAIIAGHSHTLVRTAVGDIPVVEAMSSGRAIAIVDIPIEAGGPARGRSVAAIRTIATDSIAPDVATVTWLREKEHAIEATVTRRIGTIDGPAGTLFRPDSGTGALMADAYRAAGNADVGIVNNGGVRRPFYAGPLTYGAAFDVMPFQNHLIRVAMPFQAFVRYAEGFVRGASPGVHISGVLITFDATQSPGSRIVSVTRADGSPIADTSVVTVIVNNFMEEGGDGLGLPPESRNRTDLGIDLDGFIRFMAASTSPVHMPTGSRFIRVQK